MINDHTDYRTTPDKPELFNYIFQHWQVNKKRQDDRSVCFVHMSTLSLITMGSGERREVDMREEKGVSGKLTQQGNVPATHSRHNITLHHTLHLVRNSSRPYMVMSITLVVDIKHSRKINKGSPAAP